MGVDQVGNVIDVLTSISIADRLLEKRPYLFSNDFMERKSSDRDTGLAKLKRLLVIDLIFKADFHIEHSARLACFKSTFLACSTKSRSDSDQKRRKIMVGKVLGPRHLLHRLNTAHQIYVSELDSGLWKN